MGEGVSAALESGHHAAGALMEHWNEPERALARYRERTNALRAYMRRQWSFTAGMAETFREMRT